MTLHLNDAGTWRPIQGVSVNDAGTWRSIQEIYVNDAGTWRSVFSSVVFLLPQLSTAASATAPTDAICNYRLDTDGHLRMTPSAGNNSFVDQGLFITPATNIALYSVRVTETSGTMSTGTVGSFVPLTSNQLWTVRFNGNNGSAGCVATFDFALTADTSTILYSASVQLLAAVAP